MSKKVGSFPNFAGIAATVFIGAALSGVRVWNAQADSFESWLNQPTMTGDWGGVRTTLANDGINFHAIYLGQVGTDTGGGKAQGTDYAQQVTLGADWDLQKLFNWQGAILHTYVEDRAGRPLSTDFTGSTILDDGVFGSGENFRLEELAYEQNLLNKRLNFLLGYYVLSSEFAYSPLLCGANFLSNGFCGHPQFLGVDTGFQLGPVADWGGRVRVYPTPALYVAVGAFEVNPTYLENNKGFDLNFDGATGAMVPVEIGYTTSFGPDKLVGHYKIGGIYDTSEVKDVEFNIQRNGRYAGYLMVDQQVWKDSADPQRNIAVFGEAGIADKRTATEDSWLEAGFVYQGIIPSRPEDSLNFGYIHATTNPRLLNGEGVILAKEGMSSFILEPNQQLIEVGYNIAVAKWFSFTPDFQYFWNPGSTAFKHFDNAVIVGAQARIVF
jgi:porin